MASLAERMRKAREFEREIKGWRLRLRRPTDDEARSIFGADEVSPAEVCTRFVCGWSGVTEADLVVSGGSDEVPFDRDVWREVVVDHPELWEPIASAVVDAYQQHSNKRAETAKN